MEIVKIDSGKKYVLLLPEANMAQTEEILSGLRSFIEDDVHVILAIHGTGATIVPADQVVGYRVLERQLEGKCQTGHIVEQKCGLCEFYEPPEGE